MELKHEIRKLAAALNEEPPQVDSRNRFVFEFDGDLSLRVFSIPGRSMIFEGVLRKLPSEAKQREEICKSILRTGLARYRERTGEILLKEDADELCYVKQFTYSNSENMDVAGEAETFLNELELMKGRAHDAETVRTMPFSPFSFQRP